jgi:hypothetical protein
VQLTARHPKIMASADGTGIVSQAGGLLLTQALRVTGLDRGMDAVLERLRPARAVHGPGKIITDLAVTLALGGDCLAGVAMLGGEALFVGGAAGVTDQGLGHGRECTSSPPTIEIFTGRGICNTAG